MSTPTSLAGVLVITIALTADAFSKRSILRDLDASDKAGQKPVTYIPRTDIPMPPDYEDYTRGHPPLALFPDNAIPGKRHKEPCPGEDLPCFDPANLAESAENWTYANDRDTLAVRCSGDGKGGTGHFFYNVWVPELVPFVVPPGTPGRKDSAVVIAPGGGFKFLAWELEGVAAAEWLNSLGISAFVLKYRVPNYEVAELDAHRAVSLVRSKANDYGINASRIGFMGSSAGGTMAIQAALSLSRAYPTIDVVDELPFQPNFLLLCYPAIPQIVDQHSLSSMPPTFIAYSEDDPCCSPSQTHHFVESVRLKASAPITEYAFPDGRHGWLDPDYNLWVKSLSPAHWRTLAENWLQGLRL